MLFLIGSALCGLAQNMTQLIAFRAVQGLGGGGLMVTSMAIVGDIVPPRERGRYQGLFGARVRRRRACSGRCSAASSSSTCRWRWIFYINLPLGVLALAGHRARRCHRARERRAARASTTLGTALLAVALTALILFTTLGGSTYAVALAADHRR